MKPEAAADLKAYVREQARRAKAASRALAILPTALKNGALLKMAAALEQDSARLLAANREDLAAVPGLSPAMRDRLTLDPERIRAMAEGVRQVAALPDPVGEVFGLHRRPNGMEVGRMRAPIGLIAVVYESRPNVTADSAALCLKSGNAVLLRGGSEALRSNTAIAELLARAADEAGVPEGALSFIANPDRACVMELLQLHGTIDLVIPRGGEGLIRMVAENSRIPVIKHDRGICHVYVDSPCDLKMAADICFNAKVQRPGTCNAMETMLVHQGQAADFLPAIARRLREAGVELRGCRKTRDLVPGLRAAEAKDWDTEYNDLILNVKVVDGLEEAMAHIAAHGSQHSEAIVTSDPGRARRFLREVDAAAVLVNASTRLNDGFEFGLGAEIGISTSRIHARGPMGLEELTAAKFVVLGSGQLRS